MQEAGLGSGAGLGEAKEHQAVFSQSVSQSASQRCVSQQLLLLLLLLLLRLPPEPSSDRRVSVSLPWNALGCVGVCSPRVGEGGR